MSDMFLNLQDFSRGSVSLAKEALTEEAEEASGKNFMNTKEFLRLHLQDLGLLLALSSPHLLHVVRQQTHLQQQRADQLNHQSQSFKMHQVV